MSQDARPQQPTWGYLDLQRYLYKPDLEGRTYQDMEWILYLP